MQCIARVLRYTKFNLLESHQFPCVLFESRELNFLAILIGPCIFRSRGKVCVHTIFLRPTHGLWDYTEYVVIKPLVDIRLWFMIQYKLI